MTELEAKVAQRATEKNARKAGVVGEAPDAEAQARREEQRALRELSEQARGVNLDLGAGLLNGLATVDPTDTDVARLFVDGLLGADYDSSPYTQTGERVVGLAVSGIRLVIDEFRTDVTRPEEQPSGNGHIPRVLQDDVEQRPELRSHFSVSVRLIFTSVRLAATLPPP